MLLFKAKLGISTFPGSSAIFKVKYFPANTNNSMEKFKGSTNSMFYFYTSKAR
jgi:hypothetical protein